MVRNAGGLFIADEVQAGFCRTGHWWGYETTDFLPDIVTMGKPMGNGFPLAATAARHKHITQFRKATGYFNTFASTPLQAAVGMAVLDVIEEENIQKNVSSNNSVASVNSMKSENPLNTSNSLSPVDSPKSVSSVFQ